MQIYVSGSLAYDRIMDFPGRFADHILPEKIHVINVCFNVNGLTEKFGGTAGNIAYSLHLLGEQPTILATAGKDFGRYERRLKGLGLSLDGVKLIKEEFTAGAYITTDLADNQITGFNPGAMNHPSEYKFNDIDPDNALAIISPGSLEDMLVYSRNYKEMNMPYIFDPGQSITALSGEELVEMITGSWITISNDYELELICKSTGLSRDKILRRTGVLVTTLGEEGSLVISGGEERKVPVVKALEVQDPTGAGDAFRAGLIKGLVMNKDVYSSACMGATCSSFAVECYGTQEHSFSTEEFWARHESNFGAA